MLRLAGTLLLGALALSAQDKTIAWEQTAEVFARRHVIVTLTDGSSIEGRWLAVAPDSFDMRIDKSSGGIKPAKQPQTIPRASIVRVQAQRDRVRGSVIGTLAGFYGVAAVGSAIVRSADAMQGAVGIAAIGAGIAGFFIGRTSDRAFDEFTIEPPITPSPRSQPPESPNPAGFVPGQATEHRTSDRSP